jgi:hypothetical protein
MLRSSFEQCGFVPAPEGGILTDLHPRILAGTEPFFTSSVVFSRQVFLEAGGFDEALVLREDTDLFFRLGLLTEACYVPDVMVVIDRTPNREIGLCNLYSTRDDRKNESFKRMYEKWLALPHIRGSEYEKPIWRLLCNAHYNSMEDKFRQCRWRSVVKESKRLVTLENGVIPVIRNLILRKAGKLVRRVTQATS